MPDHTARSPMAHFLDFAVAVLAPLVDIAVGTVVGFSTPVLSLLSVAAAAVMRRRALRAPQTAGRAQITHTGAVIGETRP